MDILRCVPYSINKSIRCILRKVNTPFTKKIQNIYKQLLDERLQVFSRGEPTQNLNFIFHSSPPPNILEGSNFPGSKAHPCIRPCPIWLFCGWFCVVCIVCTMVAIWEIFLIVPRREESIPLFSSLHFANMQSK